MVLIPCGVGCRLSGWLPEDPGCCVEKPAFDCVHLTVNSQRPSSDLQEGFISGSHCSGRFHCLYLAQLPTCTAFISAPSPSPSREDEGWRCLQGLPQPRLTITACAMPASCSFRHCPFPPERVSLGLLIFAATCWEKRGVFVLQLDGLLPADVLSPASSPLAGALSAPLLPP